MIGRKRPSGRRLTEKTHGDVIETHLGPRAPPFYTIFTPFYTLFSRSQPVSRSSKKPLISKIFLENQGFLFWRRRRDLNPRDAQHALLP